MKNLELNSLTNKELAEWFGIKPDTMTRHKKKKLEELQNYAFFEEVRGGVEITGIIKSEYNKKDSQIRQIYQQGFEEVRQPIDTVSNINNQIYEKYSEQLPTLSSAASGYHYAIEVRNERYFNRCCAGGSDRPCRLVLDPGKKEGCQVHWLPQRRFLRQVRLQRL